MSAQSLQSDEQADDKRRGRVSDECICAERFDIRPSIARRMNNILGADGPKLLLETAEWANETLKKQNVTDDAHVFRSQRDFLEALFRGLASAPFGRKRIVYALGEADAPTSFPSRRNAEELRKVLLAAAVFVADRKN